MFVLLHFWRIFVAKYIDCWPFFCPRPLSVLDSENGTEVAPFSVAFHVASILLLEDQ